MLERILYYYDKKLSARIPVENIVFGTLKMKRRLELSNIYSLRQGDRSEAGP